MASWSTRSWPSRSIAPTNDRMHGARPTAQTPSLWIALILGLALCGCGADRPEHAAVHAIPLDSDAGALIGLPGSRPSSGFLPRGDIEDYKGKLVGLLNKTESQLRSASAEERGLVLLKLRKQRLEGKLESPDFAFAEHRQMLNSAHSRVQGFLARFSPDLEWEARYALQAGDLSLASALIQDVVDRLRTQLRRRNRTRSDGDVLELDVPVTRDVLAAENMAAEAILGIAQLAEDSTDFKAAERGYALVRSYKPEIGVAANAAGAHAGLLRSLGREQEANEIQAEINQMLAR